MDHATQRRTVVADAPAHDRLRSDDRPLKATWPLHARQVRALVLAFVVITAVFAAAGWLLVNPFEDSALARYDEDVAQRLADARTPTWNTVSWWSSMLAETAPKIVVTAILAFVMVRRWKRWLEAVVVAVALILEASAFLATTLIVGRARPDVERLDTSPIGSSFPSGHTAAAVVYGALAVIVFWHTRNAVARAAVVVMCTLIPIAVGLARMYRGMHHVSDVVAGALLGLVCLIVTVRIATTAPEARDAVPEHAP